ncbi:MAG: HEAT repeat domain-containing protein [Thermoanaerobaculia bacterium]|jgi:HEAT repeat protein
MDDKSPRLAVQQEAGDGPLRTFVGLFMVPLLVVLICVAVFVGFGWIAYDHNSAEDYLNDLKSGWRPRRAQAAYELSKVLVADPEALGDVPGSREEIRRLFTESEDPEMRRYLALIMGYTQDPAALPLLEETLNDPDSEARIYALWALGTSGDPDAIPLLTTALQDPDSGIRKTAAFSLGELGLAAGIDPLTPLLQDGVADVRWNAALALSRLGSSAGVAVLEQMLDRGLTAQIPDLTPAQAEEAMVSAVQALGVVEGLGAKPLLEELADNDPSLKVRRAALAALDSLGD